MGGVGRRFSIYQIDNPLFFILNYKCKNIGQSLPDSNWHDTGYLLFSCCTRLIDVDMTLSHYATLTTFFSYYQVHCFTERWMVNGCSNLLWYKSNPAKAYKCHVRDILWRLEVWSKYFWPLLKCIWQFILWKPIHNELTIEE